VDGPFPYAAGVFSVHKNTRCRLLTARTGVGCQGPRATLYFIYNGLPVDGDRLQDESATVPSNDGTARCTSSLATHGLERQWRMRLAATAFRPANRQTARAWLDFMLEEIPVAAGRRLGGLGRR